MDKRALLLTRPQESAERFAALMPVDTLPICISPLLEIVSLDVQYDLTGYNGVIFTSENAVFRGPKGQGRGAYCVGERTAKAAFALGWVVLLVEQTADYLVEAIRKKRVLGPLVHLAGAHRRGEIAERLGSSGTEVTVVTLYEQHLRPLSSTAQNLLAGEVSVIVPLFSPRTATQFAEQAKVLDQVIVVAISPVVAEVIEGLPVAGVEIAQTPTGKEMLRLVENLLHKDRLP